MAQGDQSCNGGVRVLWQEASTEVPGGAPEIFLRARRGANGEAGNAGEETERRKRESHADTED